MARINPELLERICVKLKIRDARAYTLIARRAGELHVPRHLAALAVAAEAGININKKAFATDADRELLRSATLGHPVPVVANPVIHVTPRAGPIRRSASTRAKASGGARKSNSVMVVHGRDIKVRDAMFSFLRAIGLSPIEWSQALKATRSAAPFVGEIIDAAFEKAAAVVVLLTPDDEARLRTKFRSASDPDYESKLSGQARPNVLFEAGRAFGSHPRSTVLVQVGSVRPFSDTAGRHVVHMTNGADRRKDLAARLEGAGCAVDLTGSDWLKEGDFS
jgi:predicted nucleotide-binding protein